MQAEYWHNKWVKGDIGFHEHQANALLREHFHYLHLPKNSRLFLPLCGKTHDIHWLLECGFNVVGAELSELAVSTLFDDLSITPTIEKIDSLLHYSSDQLDIFVGDIFHIKSEWLGEVDAIYDRAALVALPDIIREQYTRHLRLLTSTAKQLLITFEYNQSQMQGPPFSIGIDLIDKYYKSAYSISHLQSIAVQGGLKQITEAQEHAWLLKPVA